MNSLYTVGQVVKETGVTAKTLYHYQKLNILLPSKIGENGYRYYSKEDIKLLQEILLYRTMGFSLKEVKELLSTKEMTTRIERLEQQKKLLNASIMEKQLVIQTINAAILAEKEGIDMKNEEMFKEIKKEDDSIYRTMQNFTIIFAKPFISIFFILGITLIVVYTKALINGTTVMDVNVSSRWLNFVFILIGIGTTIISGYTLFFTSTKENLKIINQKYIKKD